MYQSFSYEKGQWYVIHLSGNKQAQPCDDILLQVFTSLKFNIYINSVQVHKDSSGRYRERSEVQPWADLDTKEPWS